jgi:chromate reductase
VFERTGNVVDEIRIVGFAGSLRRGSFNRGVIRAAAESAPPGIRVEVFELTDIPLYNQDVEDAGEPASVVALKRAIAGADGCSWQPPSTTTACPEC